MKENWTYKPFMECIEKVKYTTKIQSKDFAEVGKYPIISQEDTYISGYWNNEADVFRTIRPLVIFGDHTRVLKYIDFDFVLGADGVKILLPIQEIMAKFMYYYIQWYKIPNLGYSRHFKLFQDIKFPMVPMSTQQMIVQELDAINEVLSKKREQLKELDKLAQSIFYDMFGDPVTNEKGWEVKKLGEVADITSSKRIFADEYTEQGVPFYRGKEISERSKGLNISSELFISHKRYQEIKERYGVPQKGDLLLTAVGTIGNIWVVDSEEPFYFKDGNVLWIQTKNDIDSLYFRNNLQRLVDVYKDKMANGCAYGALTIIKLVEMSIPLPPLPLQQAFAEKIEKIEQMKENLKASIHEAETLLASRMSYWFE